MAGPREPCRRDESVIVIPKLGFFIIFAMNHDGCRDEASVWRKRLLARERITLRARSPCAWPLDKNRADGDDEKPEQGRGQKTDTEPGDKSDVQERHRCASGDVL